MTRIQVLQHVEFEGLGSIRGWLDRKNYPVTTSKIFEACIMPHVDSFDGLIVMGGPMSVNDTVEFPWLVAEIELIRSSIQAGKKILGICLGAQLIARALESTVYRNRQKEIGWFPVAFTTSAKKLIPSTASDDRVTVFHWHGETFDLLAGV